MRYVFVESLNPSNWARNPFSHYHSVLQLVRRRRTSVLLFKASCPNVVSAIGASMQDVSAMCATDWPGAVRVLAERKVHSFVDEAADVLAVAPECIAGSDCLRSVFARLAGEEA